MLSKQVQLRRSWQEYPERDTDLYQWCGGSKFCSGPLEALLTLEEGGEAVEVKVRGPLDSGHVAFFFMEDLLAMIDQVSFGAQLFEYRYDFFKKTIIYSLFHCIELL